MKQTLNELKKLFGDREVYVVGGAVRDFLVGKTPNDVDLVGYLPIDFLEGLGCVFVDPKSCIPVFSLHHPVLGKIEIAHPRKERKVGNKHQDFEMETGSHVTLVDDLRRRDFTINSMAMDLDGKLIDPFGGQRHLGDMTLAPTSNAFSEDPLRVIRALRFSARGFDLTPKLMIFMGRISLADLPVERIFNEIMKAMAEDHPEEFFKGLVSLGIAKELFASIHDMVDVPAGPEEFHPEGSLFNHSIEALQKTTELTKDPVSRLASFLHDLGKVETPKDELPAHHGHDKRNTVERFLNSLKANNHTVNVAKTVAAEHMRYHKLHEMKESKVLKLVYNLMTNKAVEAMDDLAHSDDPNQFAMHKELVDKAVIVNKMNVVQLGLDVDELRARPGTTAAQMVLEARIRMLKKLRKQ
jgi:tRNA nucleotidyltransferase (CCA-adding enzyme)